MTAGSPLLPLLVVPLGLAVNAVVSRQLASRYDYECSSCGTASPMSPWTLTFAPHRFGGLKYARCPACHRLGWLAPTEKG